MSVVVAAEVNQPCPCTSGSSFADCCEPIINGTQKSMSAEQLMRARYSAFATGAVDFIVASTHSTTRDEIDIPYITEWSKTSVWQGLDIIETKEISEDKSNVSFEARFSQNGKERKHREKSLFQRENGDWRFVTGDEMKNPTVRYETPPPGRNDPCPCGSNKKFKKCCGR